MYLRRATARPSAAWTLCCGPWPAPRCALTTSRRSVFVRFQETPNEACYKFYVDDKHFLPPNSLTMMFDRGNDYQSPLARDILAALPMVEEVTVGSSFVTVKRVEKAHAAAAARYFAMKFHGTTHLENDLESAAARSEALQARADAVLHEDEPCATVEAGQDSAAATAASPSFELGGFTVEKAEEEEGIDEAALQALIAATDWSELRLHVSALITDHLLSGEPHVSPDAPHPHADTLPQDGDSEVVLMLKELIATTIRPQLQDDGGDIRFIRYVPDTAVMEVEMLGACRTCKSSKTTLVDLIERTTRHWVPEVSAVQEVRRAASSFETFVQSSTDKAVAVQMPSVPPKPEGDAHQGDDERADVTDAEGRVRVREESPRSGHRVLREVRAAADRP